jgi:hypothetical protein
MANHAITPHLGRKGTIWAGAAAAILLLAAIGYWRSGDTASAFNWPYLHPLGGIGYQFWSGIGSDVGQLTIFGAVVALWSKHNCHIHRCWRLSWHPSKKYGGHVVCRHHHEDSGTDILKER